jgi:signal transduction histidine kinase
MTASASPATASQPAGSNGSLPLERKLPLLILAILTLVLGTSLAISYYEVRRSAQLSAADRLSHLSRSLASTIEQQTSQRLGTMRRIATDTAVQAAFSTPNRAPSAAAIRAMSAIRSPSDSLTPPMLWTPDGHIIGTLRLEQATDVDQFRSTIATLGVLSDSEHVGKIISVNGHGSLWQSVPVKKDGHLLGFLAQERRFSASPRALQPIRDLIGQGIGFFMRNATDNVWVELSGAIVRPPARARAFGHGLQVLSNESSEALASTTPVHGTPFVVTLEQPMADILERPRAVIRVLTLLAIVLVLAGGIIAWAMSRQIVRPLTELTGAAEAIAHGEYSKRVAGGPRDEIGRLGAAFNRMAEQVEVASTSSTRAVEQLTKSVATQQFLADASRILSMSLSDQNLISDIARFCVPTIADYCSLHIADEDGAVRRVETIHRDPAKLEAVRALVARYQYRLDGPGEIPSVIRSQLPLVVPKLDTALVRQAAPDDDTRTLLDLIGPSSYLCVPLVARGRSVGAISLTMTDSGRTFTPDDMNLAMELARRTAVAIDNALIYRRSLALRLEAEAASSAKSDFLAKMSHEFRTPINAMIGYAELLEMQIAGPVTPAQAKQLARIRASGEHLTGLVNEILDFAKIEAGSMRIEASNGIASDAVDAALALIRPQAARKGIELDGKSENGARVEYVGDPQRVQQVLTNLLSNAVKFTPTGGKISVRWTSTARPNVTLSNGGPVWASIVVEDNGVGISASDMDRVFDPFVQLDEGYTRTQGGTGLGLAISRKLAEMMGGSITIESTLGKGSRFTLWLPSPESCTTTVA